MDDLIIHIVLYTTESFKWFLLSKNKTPIIRVLQILENLENYINSREYVSYKIS